MNAIIPDTTASVLVLLGPPGAGKRTQAQPLQEQYGLIQLSTGGLLSADVQGRTDVGVAADTMIKAGALVPQQPDIANGVILDGLNRTTAQAEAVLGRHDMRVGAAYASTVDKDGMVERVSGRGHLRILRRGVSRPLQTARQTGHLRHTRRLRPCLAGR